MVCLLLNAKLRRRRSWTSMLRCESTGRCSILKWKRNIRLSGRTTTTCHYASLNVCLSLTCFSLNSRSSLCKFHVFEFYHNYLQISMLSKIKKKKVFDYFYVLSLFIFRTIQCEVCITTDNMTDDNWWCIIHHNVMNAMQ